MLRLKTVAFFFYLIFKCISMILILYLNNTTKEELKNSINKGGIFYIFENHTQENTHIKTQQVVCCVARLTENVISKPHHHDVRP